MQIKRKRMEKKKFIGKITNIKKGSSSVENGTRSEFISEGVTHNSVDLYLLHR